MDVYMLDTPQEEILQGRPIKFDFTNEFKEGRPILRVQKLAVKRPVGGFFDDIWDVNMETLTNMMSTMEGSAYKHNFGPHAGGIIGLCSTNWVYKLCYIQTVLIKDLQEKVNALTPQEQKPVVEEMSDPFEEEVQRRLAKELYEQRINAEVQRRLAALSASKAEDGINKVFEEWKEVPIFKNLASLLNPKNVTTDGA